MTKKFQWGWVPFSGAIDKLSKATDAELAILDEIARLKQEADEAEAGAAVLCEAAALEATRAGQLNAGARKRQMSFSQDRAGVGMGFLVVAGRVKMLLDAHDACNLRNESPDGYDCRMHISTEVRVLIQSPCADACRMRIGRELRQRASLVAEASAVIDAAEAALAAGDRSKAQVQCDALETWWVLRCPRETSVLGACRIDLGVMKAGCF